MNEDFSLKNEALDVNLKDSKQNYVYVKRPDNINNALALLYFSMIFIFAPRIPALIISIALMWFFIYKTGGGSNKARIILTILLCAEILVIIISLPFMTETHILLSSIYMILSSVALFNLWKKESDFWFNREMTFEQFTLEQKTLTGVSEINGAAGRKPAKNKGLASRPQ